jgi:sRNA-binding carbon storage regulator CsrA
MRHLVLGRRVGERVFLTIDPHADPVRLLEQLQRYGIMLTVRELSHSRVRLSIEAPSDIGIARGELAEVDVRESKGYRKQGEGTLATTKASG